jgi:hypothetical protein
MLWYSIIYTYISLMFLHAGTTYMQCHTTVRNLLRCLHNNAIVRQHITYVSVISPTAVIRRDLTGDYVQSKEEGIWWLKPRVNHPIRFAYNRAFTALFIKHTIYGYMLIKICNRNPNQMHLAGLLMHDAHTGISCSKFIDMHYQFNIYYNADLTSSWWFEAVQLLRRKSNMSTHIHSTVYMFLNPDDTQLQ